MRKMFIRIFIFMVICSIVPASVYAKTGYVSDSLLLTFREGPGNSYPVIKTLESNTPVSILDEENGYYKVELNSKEVGWVDKKFIMFELPSYYIVKNLEAENKSLQSRIEKVEAANEKLEQRLSSLKNEYTDRINVLTGDLEKAQYENKQLSITSEENKKKYDALVNQSKDILKIIQENKIYQQKNQTLTKEFEALQNKYKNSFRASMIKWFIAGVVVLLAGWILGSGVSSKRRKSGSLLD